MMARPAVPVAQGLNSGKREQPLDLGKRRGQAADV